MSAPDSRPPSHLGRSRWARRYDPAQSSEAARIDADTARREAELKAAEALAAKKRAEALRAVAESTAFSVAHERDEALQRVAELEEKLSSVLQEKEAEPPVAEVPAAEEADTPAPAASSPAQPEAAEPQAPPAAEKPEVVELAPKEGSAALTLLLGTGALAGAGWAVYLAVQDRLVSGSGLVAVVATLLLALGVRRTGEAGARVSIRRGTVTVERREGVEKVDLTSSSTILEVIGEPGQRDRRVVFVRRAKAPLSVDRSMVDVDEFVDAVRLWRPEA